MAYGLGKTPKSPRTESSSTGKISNHKQTKEYGMNENMSKNKIVNINITVDTSGLIRDVPNPSKNQDSPTAIKHSYQYMVVSDNTGMSGQGTGDLSLVVNQGDVVRFYMTSEYNNFDNPVVIYKLFKISGDDVFKSSSFTLELLPNANTVTPASFNPLNVEKTTQNFWFAQNTVNNKGKENYGLLFALFDSDMKLIGYYSWDPTITAE
jgi:nematocidal protein AidA